MWCPRMLCPCRSKTVFFCRGEAPSGYYFCVVLVLLVGVLHPTEKLQSASSRAKHPIHRFVIVFHVFPEDALPLQVNSYSFSVGVKHPRVTIFALSSDLWSGCFTRLKKLQSALSRGASPDQNATRCCTLSPHKRHLKQTKITKNQQADH